MVILGIKNAKYIDWIIMSVLETPFVKMWVDTEFPKDRPLG